MNTLKSPWLRLFLSCWAAVVAAFWYRDYRSEEELRFSGYLGKSLLAHDDEVRRMRLYGGRGSAEEKEALTDRDRVQAEVDRQKSVVDSYGDTGRDLYVFGLAMPPVAASTATWVIAGFRRSRKSVKRNLP